VHKNDVISNLSVIVMHYNDAFIHGRHKAIIQNEICNHGVIVMAWNMRARFGH